MRDENDADWEAKIGHNFSDPNFMGSSSVDKGKNVAVMQDYRKITVSKIE